MTNIKYDKIIMLRQLKPKIKKSTNKLNFVAELLYDNKKCGKLFGETTLIDRIDNNTEIRSRKLYFNLCNGLIISEGLSEKYDSNNSLLKEKNEISIIGGTNEYEGVTGKIITQRFENGEHEQILYINWN